MTSNIVRWFVIVGAVFFVVVLAGCGGVEGDYACQSGLLDSLKLESGGKTDMGMTYLGQKMQKTGTYSVDGNNVNLVIDGQTTVFAHSGKMLDGGEMNSKCTAK